MKLTSNFQISPIINVYNGLSFITGSQEEITSDNQFLDKLNSKVDSKIVTPESMLALEKKIEYYCLNNNNIDKDTWRELAIYRPPTACLVNYTNQEYNSNIPIMPIKTAMFLPKARKNKNKAMCFTPGVLYFQHLSCDSDYSLPMAVYNVLKDMGVNIEFRKNDFEIKGKKFFGFLNEELPNKYFYSECMLTFNYEDEIFKNLPDVYYTRSYIEGKEDEDSGITGLLNEYPDLDINDIIKRIIEFLGYRI